MLRAWYGELKFSGQHDVQHEREADGHVGVSGEVEVQLQREASVAPHASAKTTTGARSKIGATHGLKVSAIITFLNSPMAKMNSPLATLPCEKTKVPAAENCGTSSLNRTIGPAIRCGKEADEQAVAQEIVVAGVPVRDIHQIGDLFEREEGDRQRQDEGRHRPPGADAVPTVSTRKLRYLK